MSCRELALFRKEQLVDLPGLGAWDMVVQRRVKFAIKHIYLANRYSQPGIGLTGLKRVDWFQNESGWESGHNIYIAADSFII